jgi:hypothetical protein
VRQRAVDSVVALVVDFIVVQVFPVVHGEKSLPARPRFEPTRADPLLSLRHHISPFGEMGASRPFLLRGPSE